MKKDTKKRIIITIIIVTIWVIGVSIISMGFVCLMNRKGKTDILNNFQISQQLETSNESKIVQEETSVKEVEITTESTTTTTTAETITTTTAETIVTTKPPESTTDKETETEVTSTTTSQTTESTTESVELNIDDLYVLSHVISAEAGNCSWEHQIGVGSVVLNRVKDERFPNTIHGVVFQNGQYSCTWNGGYYKEPTQTSIEVAKYLLENGSQYPEYVIFQSEFKQANRVYKQIDNTYFCYYAEDVK